jgi:hypothetical protein
MRGAHRSTTTLLALLFCLLIPAGHSQAQSLEPIRYTFRVIDAAKHIAEVDARIPSSGQPTLDLMMPIWTPGFYRVEDYAGRVQSLVAKTPDGVTLDVTKPTPNRWQVATKGSPAVLLTYRLLCQGRSVRRRLPIFRRRPGAWCSPWNSPPPKSGPTATRVWAPPRVPDICRCRWEAIYVQCT